MKLFLTLAFLTIMILGIVAIPAHAQRQLSKQTFQTAAGEVTISPIYHASILIEGGGKVIYIDPAKPGNFAGLPKADLILITHEHADHVDQDLSSIKAISKDGTKIWATEAVAKFVPNASVLYNGEIKKLDKQTWAVDVVPAYSLVRGPSAGKFYHPSGEGNGYILSYGGMRFYFSGDTEAVPEIKALKNIQVAFICMNLPYTMTPAEAADLVRAFKPKIVIPYHYQAQPATDFDVFTQKLAGTGIEVRQLDWYPAN